MFTPLAGFIKLFSNKIRDDYMSSFAAQAAFFIFLSAFPFLMFLLTLLHYLPLSENQMLDLVVQFIPLQIRELVISMVGELYNKTSGTLLSVTIITALWSASVGILAIYRGLNCIYHITETRNYFILRFRSVMYTILLAVMLIMILGLYVFGNQIIMLITDFFPDLIISRPAVLVVTFRNFIGIAVLFVIFMFMYKYIPNRKTKLHREIPGAVVSSVGWILFSYLYSFYIDNLSNMTTTYGSLTAIVLCMVWLYSLMGIFFFGAEFNSVLCNVKVRDAVHEALENYNNKKAQE